MNILLNKHKSHLQRDCWLKLFSPLSEIFIIRKQQACFEKLFFRVLELQNFFMSKILAMNIFLSKHKSSQNAESCQRYQRYFFEFCIHWESDICGQVNFTFCQQIRNAACCVCRRTEFQKSQGADCWRLSSMPLPLAPYPIVSAFARLYLLHDKP